MKQLRLISGFLILAMALAAIACSNPAAAPAALATYSVTYDANGATGGSAPDAQTKTQGTALTLANQGSLVRTGYTFDGWNTAADSSGTPYAAGATYTTDLALSLHAKWTALPVTADLTSLTLSGNPTGYAFSAGTYTYSGISVPNATTDVTVTPTGAGAITVNGTAVASRSASASISLSAGSATTITVVATEAGKTAKTYTLSVTRRLLLAVGDIYDGGKVGYILVSGDPGYSAADQHGLIIATADQSTESGIIWALPDYQAAAVPAPGATGAAYGTGLANTNAIIAQNGAGTEYAAGLARACTDGGNNDWFLPSKDELNKLYLNKVAIGGFGPGSWFWSSSEDYENDGRNAWIQGFDDGRQYGFDGDIGKGNIFLVRAVRAF